MADPAIKTDACAVRGIAGLALQIISTLQAACSYATGTSHACSNLNRILVMGQCNRKYTQHKATWGAYAAASR
jgi:hypothetical protein